VNDQPLQELKIVVEQAVRPVRATMARKRRMREELLGHLIAIFEEEAARLGDDQAALDQAKRRFGDPRELTAELQETVPWWDKLARLSEAAGLRGPRESLLHFAARVTVAAMVFVAVPMLILAPIVSLCGRQRSPDELDFMVRTLFFVGISNVPLTVCFILLTDGMYRSLYRGPKNRSWRQAAIYGLLSMAFFPVLAFAWCWALTGNLAMSCTQLRLGCYFVPLAPVLFAGLAGQAAKQLRDYEEWASLEVDG
jgi:ATP-dependent Clp protease ATP-binding subunit ClpC